MTLKTVVTHKIKTSKDGKKCAENCPSYWAKYRGGTCRLFGKLHSSGTRHKKCFAGEVV